MANNNHFNLTLDTLAPTGSITRAHEFIKQNEALTIAHSGGAQYMKVWFDTNATGSKSDAGYTSASWVAVATSKQTEFVTDGNNYYYHLVLMDDVNNESEVYNTGKICFDTTAPVVSGAYLQDPDSNSKVITNNKTGNKIHFAWTEEGSGVVSGSITGASINTIPLVLNKNNSSHDGTFDFKSGVEDGSHTLSIVVTDDAGNSSVAATVSITLDTHLNDPVFTASIGGEAMGAYINTHNITLALSVPSPDADINGYKIWEGSVEPDEWVALDSAGILDYSGAFVLSSGDGAKVLHAKVRDVAGNIKEATAINVTIDTVPPVVNISTNKAIISNVSGFNTATLTLSGTDATAGVKSYELKCGSTTIDSGTVVPANFSLTSANSMVANQANTITLYVTDNAGNTNSATCTVTLDTTAPSVSIGALNTWYKQDFNISVTSSDDSGVTKLYAWSSTVAADTTVPSGYSGVDKEAGTQTIAYANIENTGRQQTASNYMHVKAVDSVGNAGYAHVQYGFDSVAPAAPTVTFVLPAYASASANINITNNATTDTSGVVKMNISGDITNGTGTGEWENWATTRAVTLTADDGLKHVQVKVLDAAGNESVLSTAAETELDTTIPTAGLALFEANGSTAKAAVSPVSSLTARIQVVSDDSLGGCEYKLYGDFTAGAQAAQGITEQAASWETFVPDANGYMFISGLNCTSGDGEKDIYVKIKDNAGNVSEAVMQSFVYDTVPPTVVVSDEDYNIISKVHELRRDAEGPITGKYADEMHFIFTPSEVIQAYKVCAYADQAAALAGSSANDAIPTTAGSTNMSATGLSSAAAVSCMIKGADFEVAIGGSASDAGAFDGLHIVVVYVQDLAGVWSAAAVFSA